MLKYSNQEHTTIIDTDSGQSTRRDHWGWAAWLQPQLDAGEQIAPWKSETELLDAAKREKIVGIEAAFVVAEQQPVSVGGHSYTGGLQSGLTIDAQRRAMVEYALVNPLAGITSVDFFDVAGAKVTLPLSSDTEIDALDVCLALHQSASANAFKCAQLIAALHAAKTLPEIEAITW